MLKQKLRLHHMMSVSNLVEENNFHNPFILQWLFDEEEETHIENVKTEKKVIE